MAHPTLVSVNVVLPQELTPPRLVWPGDPPWCLRPSSIVKAPVGGEGGPGAVNPQGVSE